jgi:hypothetical protein
VFDDDTALMREEDDAVDAIVDEPDAAPTIGAGGDMLTALPGVASVRKKWLLPAGLAGLAAIISVSAIALVARQNRAQPVAPPPAAPKPVVAQARTPVSAPLLPVVPLPQLSPTEVAAADSAARVLATTDSIRAAARRRARRLALDSARKADSLAKIDSVRPDTNPE